MHRSREGRTEARKDWKASQQELLMLLLEAALDREELLLPARPELDWAVLSSSEQSLARVPPSELQSAPRLGRVGAGQARSKQAARKLMSGSPAEARPTARAARARNRTVFICAGGRVSAQQPPASSPRARCEPEPQQSQRSRPAARCSQASKHQARFRPHLWRGGSAGV